MKMVSRLAARFPRVRARPVPGIAVRGDKAFTVVAVAVVGLVAVIAFSASYQHQYELAIRHGQTHWVAGMLPLSVDLLIVAAGLVIWYAALHNYPRPLRAYLALGAGVAATVIANLAADARGGWAWLGPGISVWPAIAFVAAYEMAVWLARKRQATRHPGAGGDAVSPVIPGDAETAAIASLRATRVAGNPWSQNQLMTRFGLTRTQATKVRDLVAAEANGQHPPDPGEPPPDN